HQQLIFFFFFSSRRRHTRSDRDWSSDVCSSDLDQFGSYAGPPARRSDPTSCPRGLSLNRAQPRAAGSGSDQASGGAGDQPGSSEIGRASCRERGWGWGGGGAGGWGVVVEAVGGD